MSFPIYEPQSLASRFWIILWTFSGVFVPLVLAALFDQDLYIDGEGGPWFIACAMINAAASVGVGLARGRFGLAWFALMGGWLLIGGLFVAAGGGSKDFRPSAGQRS